MERAEHRLFSLENIATSGMTDQASLIASLFERTEHFTRTSAELYRLKSIDKSADIVSTLTAHLAVVSAVVLFFLIVNIGIALWLGELIGKVYYGFFIVGGFYAVAGVILHFVGTKWIKTPLQNAIITQALK
jgi:hypothetical protein